MQPLAGCSLNNITSVSQLPYPWLDGNEGTERIMETTTMGLYRLLEGSSPSFRANQR